MGIELPGPAVAVMNVIGLPWPNVDEDQVRGWAADVRGFCGEITALSGASHQAVAALAAGNESMFVKTLTGQWDHHHQLIEDMRGPMEVFAGALDVAADAIEVQKGVIIAAAVAMAAEFTATQIGAFFTFGIDEAAVPAEVAATRLAVKAALQYLEGQLIGDLCNLAANEIKNQVGRAIMHLIGGGVQVAGTVAAFRTDLQAFQELSRALRGHGQQADTEGRATVNRATSRQLETSSPCGGWQVAKVVETMLIDVGETLFKDLPQAIVKIIQDTISVLKNAVTSIRREDENLAQQARQTGDTGTVATASAATVGGTAAGGGIATSLAHDGTADQAITGTHGDGASATGTAGGAANGEAAATAETAGAADTGTAAAETARAASAGKEPPSDLQKVQDEAQQEGDKLGVKFEWTRADNIDPEVASAVSKQAVALEKAYPGTLKGVVAVHADEKIPGGDGRTFGDDKVQMWARLEDGKVYVNSDWHASKAPVEQWLNEHVHGDAAGNNVNFRAPGAETVEGNFSHEFGHLVYERINENPAAYRELNGVVKQHIPEYSLLSHNEREWGRLQRGEIEDPSPTHRGIFKNVSYYGMKTPDEMYAETFMEHVRSAEPRPFAHDIGQVFDKHLKAK